MVDRRRSILSPDAVAFWICSQVAVLWSVVRRRVNPVFGPQFAGRMCGRPCRLQ